MTPKCQECWKEVDALLKAQHAKWVLRCFYVGMLGYTLGAVIAVMWDKL